MVARRKGYRLTAVLPDNASRERLGLLRLFGAEIVFSDGDRGTNGSIEVARALADDPSVQRACAETLPTRRRTRRRRGRSLADLPAVTHFVAGMGTGGTLTGVGRALHRHDPTIQVVAAEPELGDLVYGLRSLDEGFVPPIFDPAEVNRKFLVNSDDAVRATRALTSQEGIFAGISSSAVVHVARRVARSEARRGRRGVPARRRRLEVPVHRGVGRRPRDRQEAGLGVPVVVADRRPDRRVRLPGSAA